MMLSIMLLTILCPAASNNIYWHTVKDYDGQNLLHGKTVLSNKELPLNYYNRLPASSKNTTRPSIYGLQQQPAGMFVQFQSNSSSIHVNYTLGSSNLGMWHFPASGVSGMDAYAWDTNHQTWRWIGTSQPTYPTTVSTMTELPAILANNARRHRCVAPNCPTETYRIHLCTYNRIQDNFAIGLTTKYDTFVPDASHFQSIDEASIVWYGSSILQGAVASRPGQIMTHQVSRTLETLIYNFGFSGNCLMELSVAQYLIEINPKPSLFIIDCNPNMNYTLIRDRAVPLIQFIRQNGHPTTPIIMTEGTKHGTDWYSLSSRVGRYNKTRELKIAYDALIAKGDEHLYYSTSQDIYSASLGMKPEIAGDNRFLVDPTVGGTHPSDLGMRKQATYWEKKIPFVLAEDAKKTNQKLKKKLNKKLNVNVHGNVQTSAPSLMYASLQDNAWEDHKDMNQLDNTMKTVVDPMTNWKWTNGADLLKGFSTFKDENGKILSRNSPYNRLPSVAQADVRVPVWLLSEMSTGMYLKFTTNATDIAINHTLATDSENLWLMPPTGTDGLDIYAWSSFDTSWRHVPVTTGVELFAGNGKTMSGVFHQPEPEHATNVTHWTYLIYLPLRNAPKNLQIGIPTQFDICTDNDTDTKKCKNDRAPQFNKKYKPIIWYGTSIQQGAAASRAGNEYDAIISRALSMDVHNFGFAGDGFMELSVIKYLNMVEASIIVIDCLPNMVAEAVKNNTIPLVEALRSSKLHQNTPIILAEGTPYPAEWFHGLPYADAPKNQALKDAFNTLVANGIQNLHYVKGQDLFKNPLINPTVGGVHSSDLGQYEIADYYTGFIPTVLNAATDTKDTTTNTQVPTTSTNGTHVSSTHICVSSFATQEQLDNLPWTAISDLIQSISPITIQADGSLTTLDSNWFLPNLRNNAHGNHTRMWVGIKVPSKAAAATFLNLDANVLTQTAKLLASMVAEASYDGFQIDIEGLQVESKAGLETFVKACAAAALKQNIHMTTTVYSLKFLSKNIHAPTAYDPQLLSRTGDGIFIMGYDMTWLGSQPGDGYKYAGPCAPLDGLNATLHRAIIVDNALPSGIVLGLPAYGRVFTCDGGDAKSKYGNCTCLEKNFHKKSLDIMANVMNAGSDLGCTEGYNEITATPYWECPHGSSTSKGTNPNHLRQQGWYENAKGLSAKIDLARSYGVWGVGLWTAMGISGGSGEDIEIWELFRKWRD